MTTEQILFVFTIINGVIVIANFLGSNRKNGQQDGVIMATLEHIKNIVIETKEEIKDIKKQNTIFDERLTRVEVSCENAHKDIKRIEDTLQLVERSDVDG